MHHRGRWQLPEPEIVVVESAELGDVAVDGVPLLVVEILSRSNRGSDLLRKRALYAEAGCPNYWIVDPDGPTVNLMNLEGDSYSESGSHRGSERIVVDRRVELSFNPSDL